jgi:hypothetical protein
MLPSMTAQHPLATGDATIRLLHEDKKGRMQFSIDFVLRVESTTYSCNRICWCENDEVTFAPRTEGTVTTLSGKREYKQLGKRGQMMVTQAQSEIRFLLEHPGDREAVVGDLRRQHRAQQKHWRELTALYDQFPHHAWSADMQIAMLAAANGVYGTHSALAAYDTL